VQEDIIVRTLKVRRTAKLLRLLAKRGKFSAVTELADEMSAISIVCCGSPDRTRTPGICTR
jgi:hypothetical protein